MDLRDCLIFNGIFGNAGGVAGGGMQTVWIWPESTDYTQLPEFGGMRKVSDLTPTYEQLVGAIYGRARSGSESARLLEAAGVMQFREENVQLTPEGAIGVVKNDTVILVSAPAEVAAMSGVAPGIYIPEEQLYYTYDGENETGYLFLAFSGDAASSGSGGGGGGMQVVWVSSDETDYSTFPEFEGMCKVSDLTPTREQLVGCLLGWAQDGATGFGMEGARILRFPADFCLEENGLVTVKAEGMVFLTSISEAAASSLGTPAGLYVNRGMLWGEAVYGSPDYKHLFIAFDGDAASSGEGGSQEGARFMIYSNQFPPSNVITIGDGEDRTILSRYGDYYPGTATGAICTHPVDGPAVVADVFVPGHGLHVDEGLGFMVDAANGSPAFISCPPGNELGVPSGFYATGPDKVNEMVKFWTVMVTYDA